MITEIQPIIANLLKPNSRLLEINCDKNNALKVDKKIAITSILVEKLSDDIVIKFLDQSFDYALLSHIIQDFAAIEKTLHEMLRVAEYSIVILSNKNFCNSRKFKKLCKKNYLKIEKEIFVNNFGKILGWFFAKYKVILIRKDEFSPTAEAEFVVSKNKIFSPKMTPQFAYSKTIS